jgi:hypothetical protein
MKHHAASIRMAEGQPLAKTDLHYQTTVQIKPRQPDGRLLFARRKTMRARLLESVLPILWGLGCLALIAGMFGLL